MGPRCGSSGPPLFSHETGIHAPDEAEAGLTAVDVGGYAERLRLLGPLPEPSQGRADWLCFDMELKGQSAEPAELWSLRDA